MEFSRLLHGFVKIDTKISLSCHMDLSKLLHGFALVVTRICLSCFMYFSPFAKQNQAEVWPRFQSLLKLPLWTKGVESIQCLPLCLWQYSKLNLQDFYGFWINTNGSNTWYDKSSPKPYWDKNISNRLWSVDGLRDKRQEAIWSLRIVEEETEEDKEEELESYLEESGNWGPAKTSELFIQVTTGGGRLEMYGPL